MPVSTTAYSRSQIAQPHTPTLALFETWFISKALTGWKPVQGEIISALEGAVSGEIVGEGTGGWKRAGGISYSFTPSHLRTDYTLNDFTVVFPKVRWALSKAKEGEGEFEFGQNWLAVLRIGGAVYFVTEPTASTTFTIKDGGEFTIGPKVVQIQFQESVVAQPGSTIEIEIIPFIQVLRVIKSAELFNIALNAGLFAEGKANAATLIYQQEYRATRKREEK